jgi:hypothetical protein
MCDIVGGRPMLAAVAACGVAGVVFARPIAAFLARHFLKAEPSPSWVVHMMRFAAAGQTAFALVCLMWWIVRPATASRSGGCGRGFRKLPRLGPGSWESDEGRYSRT